MLGCFVGSANTAARGVPDRFLGKAKEDKKTTVETAKDQSVAGKAEPANNASAPASASTEPIEVDS